MLGKGSNFNELMVLESLQAALAGLQHNIEENAGKSIMVLGQQKDQATVILDPITKIIA